VRRRQKGHQAQAPPHEEQRLHVPAGDLFPRVAGGGSLGRPRYVAVAFWRGGQILREAKALVPSAWTWANGGKSRASHFRALANGKYRAPDPFLDVHGKFIFRRIAADSRKIELADISGAQIKVKRDYREWRR
jgi:hypothetical protein